MSCNLSCTLTIFLAFPDLFACSLQALRSHRDQSGMIAWYGNYASIARSSDLKWDNRPDSTESSGAVIDRAKTLVALTVTANLVIAALAIYREDDQHFMMVMIVVVVVIMIIIMMMVVMVAVASALKISIIHMQAKNS